VLHGVTLKNKKSRCTFHDDTQHCLPDILKVYSFVQKLKIYLPFSLVTLCTDTFHSRGKKINLQYDTAQLSQMKLK
jgi:hypothetical protein